MVGTQSMVAIIVEKRWSSNTSHHSLMFMSLSAFPQGMELLFYFFYGFITLLAGHTLLLNFNLLYMYCKLLYHPYWNSDTIFDTAYLHLPFLSGCALWISLILLKMQLHISYHIQLNSIHFKCWILCVLMHYIYENMSNTCTLVSL